MIFHFSVCSLWKCDFWKYSLNDDICGQNSGILLSALIQALTQAKSRSLLIKRRDRLLRLKSACLKLFIFTAQFIIKRTSPARSKRNLIRFILVVGCLIIWWTAKHISMYWSLPKSILIRCLKRLLPIWLINFHTSLNSPPQDARWDRTYSCII